MSLTKEQVAEAARTALGRKGKSAEDAALFAMYKDVGSVEKLQNQFARSEEAEVARVDGTKFGVEYVDSVGEKEKPYLDAYQSIYGKGARISKDTLYRWSRSGTPEFFEAKGKGLLSVRQDEKSGARTVTITKKGWDQFGDKLITGLHGGEAVLVEKGAKATTTADRFKAYTDVDEKTAAKYDVFVKEQKKRSGVVGKIAKKVGFSSGAANSFDRAAGQVAGGLSILGGDEAAAILGGTRGAAGRQQMFEKLGVSPKNLSSVDRYGDIAESVAAGIGDGLLASLGVTGGAPILSTANTLAQSTEQEMLYGNTDWNKVGRDLAVDWAVAGVGYGLNKGVNMAAGAGNVRTAAALKTAQYAWGYGGREAASTAAKGGTGEDILFAAGRGLVTGMLPGDATTQGTAAFALSYADSKRRGLSNEDAMTQAGISAGAAIAGSALSGRPQGVTASWKGRFGQGGSLRSDVADLRQGYRGTMPTRWLASSGASKAPVNRNTALVRDPYGLRRGNVGFDSRVAAARERFTTPVPKLQVAANPAASPRRI